MNNERLGIRKKSKRIYKRIFVISTGIILFVFVSGKAIQEYPPQNAELPPVEKEQTVIAEDFSQVKAPSPVVVSSVVSYECDRYARNRWKRFVCLDTPLSRHKDDQTDYFEVAVSGTGPQQILVQTLAGNRVSHCSLYGPGARVVDGNGFEIRMESFENGVYRFAINNYKPRAALSQVYFKFPDSCQVLGAEEENKITRISLTTH